MKRIRTIIHAATAVVGAVSMVLLGLTAYINLAAPDHYYNVEGETFSISSMFGIQVNTSYEEDAAAQAGTDTPVSQQVGLSLFGIIPIKTATVDTVPEIMLAPCVTPFGVKILTDGVIVVGLNDITTADGTVNPGKQANIQTGDIIYKINGVEVSSNDDVAKAISSSKGETVSVELQRDGKNLTLPLTPALSSIDNTYKAGLWVRDSSAGIGTVSFYDPQTGAFGGLGHAISDVDTGEVLPVLKGDVVNVKSHDIVKGTVGTPGELRGSFV